jgi:hypothetical protein
LWLFDPMIDHATRPSMLRAADTVFGPGSPWLPLIPDATAPGIDERPELLETRIWCVPAFQRYALDRLSDQHVLGTLKVADRRDWELRLTNGIGFSTTALDSEDGFPPQPTSFPVRTCDYYAYHLAHQDKAPKFELYWDQARRDPAIGDLVVFLRGLKP